MAKPAYTTVIASGQLLPSLEATRDLIARDLEQCNSYRDRAALYRRLVDLLTRIDTARPRTGSGDAVDEIAKRRDARRSAGAKTS
jgi:hypothetical protein